MGVFIDNRPRRARAGAARKRAAPSPWLSAGGNDADARRMMFDVSEKRAFISILREAVDDRQLDLGRFGVDPNAPGLDVDKVYAGARAQSFGGSFREGIIRVKQQERQLWLIMLRVYRDRDVRPMAPTSSRWPIWPTIDHARPCKCHGTITRVTAAIMGVC